MKYLYLICRILLAFVFIFFGLNGLHPFLHYALPPAASMPGKFMAVMIPSGWLHFVSALQVLGGILVLIGGTAPFGLIILAPITVNILCFHLLIAAGEGIAPGLIVTLLEIVLIYAYRSNFAGIFTYKATPTL